MPRCDPTDLTDGQWAVLEPLFPPFATGKLLKRQGYGRATLPVLRARVLAA